MRRGIRTLLGRVTSASATLRWLKPLRGQVDLAWLKPSTAASQKIYYVVFVLMISLLLTGFSCDKYAKAGQLAKDFAATALVAQQLEIQAYNGGYIQPAAHRAIETKFSQLADAGVRLDQAINQAHNAQGARAQVDVAASLLSDLSNNQITGIKDEKTRLAVQAAILSCQTILDNIAAFAR